MSQRFTISLHGLSMSRCCLPLTRLSLSPLSSQAASLADRAVRSMRFARCLVPRSKLPGPQTVRQCATSPSQAPQPASVWLSTSSVRGETFPSHILMDSSVKMKFCHYLLNPHFVPNPYAVLLNRIIEESSLYHTVTNTFIMLQNISSTFELSIHQRTLKNITWFPPKY